MTKAVLEAGSEEEAQRTAATAPSTALAVPASLHASLIARLDRLGPAKEVAQIGAAIGREFSHALLAAVTHKADAELQSALDRLMAAGLLFRQGRSLELVELVKLLYRTTLDAGSHRMSHDCEQIDEQAGPKHPVDFLFPRCVPPHEPLQRSGLVRSEMVNVQARMLPPAIHDPIDELFEIALLCLARKRPQDSCTQVRRSRRT
jgi:hypothetical protein